LLVFFTFMMTTPMLEHLVNRPVYFGSKNVYRSVYIVKRKKDLFRANF
jgi:hypothetical protein